MQAPLTALLSRNKLKSSDVDAVELLGGGSRVPKLQAALSEALGGRWVCCILLHFLHPFLKTTQSQHVINSPVCWAQAHSWPV